VTWFSYIVWTANDQFYTGVTTDLDRRVYEHNHEQKKASKMCWANRPVMLVWYREEKSKSAAYKAEARIKKLSREKKIELIASLPDDKKVELLKKRKHDSKAMMLVAPRPPKPPPREPCGHPGCLNHVSHPCEGCGCKADVIPPLEEIIKRIRAHPITSDCTPEILAKHKVMLATEIRGLLSSTGWRRGGA
jgi:putative endonuclease